MRPALASIALVMLALAGRDGGAQRPPSGGGGTAAAIACAATVAEAERQLVRLEDEWNRARTTGDTAFFTHLLANDFVAVGGAESLNKAQYVVNIRRAVDRATAAGRVRTPDSLSGTRVRLLGDVAVVSGSTVRRGVTPVQRRYTEVFVCRDGRWHAVHGHYSDVPPPSSTDTTRVGAEPAPSAAAPAADTILTAAEAAQRANRGVEARTILERGARSATAVDRRLLYQGVVGDSYLYEGDVDRARAAYTSMLRDATAARVDSMANWAHYGVALADAFAGRAREAEAHLAQSLRLAGWTGTDSIVDKIMVYAAAGRAEQALTQLGILEGGAPREPGTVGSPQFVHAFRGYALAQGGRCDEALQALGQAPQQERPLILAVRATCATKAGRRAEAIATRDRVLGSPPAEPFAWPYLIARHVARQVR